MGIAIIGASASGIAFAEALRKKDENVEITIFSEEQALPYYRPELSHMLGTDQIGSKFFLKEEAFYRDKNIGIRLKTKVSQIHRATKEISLDTGEKLPYDKLVIATGSNSFVPPVPGMDFEGVFALRTYEDLCRINSYLDQAKKVAILGGGLLGVEAAWALLKAGKKVLITDLADALISRQLDRHGADMVQKELGKSGVSCHLGVSSTMEGQGKITGLSFSDGTREDCEMLLVSVGVRPRIELAKAAGLSVNRGIVVDDYLRTSDEDIYAIGDVAEYKGSCSGIWPTAQQMGKMAADSMHSKQMPAMKTTPPVTILKALDIGVYSAGDIREGENKSDYVQEEDQRYMRLFFEADRFVGAILLGNTKISSALYSMLMKGASKEEVLCKIKEK